MFIIENGKITSDKTLDIGKLRVINLVFKSDLDFADDDKFKLILGDIQSVNFAFVNDGCFRFSYVNVAEIIKKENTDLSVKVTCNDEQILSDQITLVAEVQGVNVDFTETTATADTVLNGYKFFSADGQIISGNIDNCVISEDELMVNVSKGYLDENKTFMKADVQIEGVIYNNAPKKATEVKIVPFDFTKDFTDFSYMFYECESLKSISQLDTSNGTDFSGMFFKCESLTSIPQLDTSNGTDFNSTFRDCDVLTSIPQLDTSNGTDFASMFYFSGIKTIPQLDVSNGTNFNNMFGYTSVTSIPQLDVNNGASFNNMFYWCSLLTDFGGLLNVKYSYSLSYSNNLTHQSLLNVLNGLFDLTGSTSQTLTLGSTNLAKLTDEEKAIATNKNWVLA